MNNIIWKILKYPPRILYAIGLGSLYGRIVLLLTTTGRKSGLPRVTALQYEEIEGAIFVAAARGRKADWFKNIETDHNVEIRVKSKRFRGIAEPVTDPKRIADFLEYRLKRHPRMVASIMRSEGLSPSPTRQQLEAYAAKRAMVIIHPVKTNGEKEIL